MIKRALISVSDKTGIVEFAKALAALGVDIVSTGGTAAALNGAGVPTTEVQDLTGFPECLDGRVKTLHPKIHGGLLAVRSNEGHMEQMRVNGVDMIDLVVVNLYPFKKTIERPDATLAEAIENIDIGGPAMLRSAAKNYQDVMVIVDPGDYAQALDAIARMAGGGADDACPASGVTDGGCSTSGGADGGSLAGGVNVGCSTSGGADNGSTATKTAAPESLNFRLAVKAFEHTASYDALIASHLGAAMQREAYFPDKLTLTFEKKQQMRYGENPHQGAAFYADPIPQRGSLATYTQLHGKELSYNNIGDLDGALSLLAEFDRPAVVAVKHANPCGAAVADDIYSAWTGAYESDKMSIYGGIIAANRTIDARVAAEIRKIFIEIVAAPGFDDEALKILSRKKNIRLLAIDPPAAPLAAPPTAPPAAPPAAPRGAADRAVGGAGSEVANGAADGAAGGPTSGPTSGATNVSTGGPMYMKKVGGGLLLQTNDNIVADMYNIKVVTEKKPTDIELADMSFAMAVVKHTKSNAIVLAKGNATTGVGPGQNSRIMAAKIAIEVAGDRAKSSVAASDAFFPMDDCVEAFAAAGVTAIIQPGGSVNDAESIEACNRHGIAMVFTGIRHFRH